MAEPSTPKLRKAARVTGNTLVFRNAETRDAGFILGLRTDVEKSKFLSPVSDRLSDQEDWLGRYAADDNQAYFIIEYSNHPIGTVRLYDERQDSFCWGSWILFIGHSLVARCNGVCPDGLCICGRSFGFSRCALRRA